MASPIVTPAQAPAFHGTDVPSKALIDTCVHCGFCLPTCPTYVLWGQEADSPRGRIYLMRAGLEGRAALTETFVRHFDACLGCVACVTACPSGVQYGPLIERTRAQIEQHYPRPLSERAFRTMLFRVLPYPDTLRLLLTPVALTGGLLRTLARSLSSLPLPRQVSALLRMTPDVSWASLRTTVPERTAAVGPVRLKVGMLTGCVQRVMFPHVNRATVNVLAAEGCDVLAPSAQGCCGALSRHAGRLDEARAFARKTIETFEGAGVDRVVVNAAGCGSSMKEYGELLADDPAWADRAHRFTRLVRDASELLAELGQPRAPRHPLHARVAYHDACHLAHAQGIRAQPRDLLRGIPGLELVELPEPEICCGSAGIYNLVQPEAAAELGTRKAKQIVETTVDFVATGNPGCTVQIGAALERLGADRRILHPLELLEASISGKAAKDLKGTAR